MNPRFCIATCPICGGGLCGVRVCHGATDSEVSAADDTDEGRLHGFVICDECEAIWLEPDVATVHQYPSVTEPQCPTCGEALWGSKGHWADASDLQTLGWESAIDHSLDAVEADGEGGAV